MHPSHYWVDNCSIMDHIDNNDHFFIARLGGDECNVIASGENMSTLESNAGIRCSNDESLRKYIHSCKEAYQACTMICQWDGYIKNKGQEYLLQHIIPNDVPRVNAMGLWAYYFLDKDNWVESLRGKTILIIHPFVDTIERQLRIRSKLFFGSHYHWFDECTFRFLSPPVTLAGNHQNKEWYEHMDVFIEKLDQLQSEEDFEVALVSCGGYGIPICGHIYEKLQRSAIYVGGALQIFFGIIGERWEKEEAEILQKYRNEYWTRPSENEKPSHHKTIEGGCYW